MITFYCIIFQQYDALLGDLKGGLIVAVGAEEAIGLVSFHGRAIVQTKQTTHLVVEFLRGVLALTDALLIRIGEIIAVVSVGLAHRQTVSPGAELEVKSILHSLVSVVAASPVRDHHAVETPVLFQDLVEHDIIVAVVLAFVEIVGTHDAPGVALLHSSLEGRQVDLMQGTVGDNDVHLMTVFLVVV